MKTLHRTLLLIVMVAASLLVMACSGGPAAPQKGTPAFYWQAANETYAAGDYMKTNEHLASILKSDNEFNARAMPWRLVLSAGMTHGFMELADGFEFGARANKANPTPFRKQVNMYRNFASNLSMQFIESLQKFHQNSMPAQIPLAFTYPTGSAAPVPQLAKIGSGMVLQEPDLTEAQKMTLQRSVLMFTCQAVGAPDDTAKAQQLFKSGNVQVPREVFVEAMAEALFDQAQLFGRAKLDLPDRFQLFSKNALESLKTVPESKATKDLTAKIEKALKAAK